MRFAHGGGMQGETCYLGQQAGARCIVHWRQAVEGEGFKPCMRTNALFLTLDSHGLVAHPDSLRLDNRPTNSLLSRLKSDRNVSLRLQSRFIIF